MMAEFVILLPGLFLQHLFESCAMGAVVFVPNDADFRIPDQEF